MTNTLATRKQSEAIRARMRQIRTELPYDVDEARQDVRRLTDWRYQFRQHPVAAMSAAALLGYLVVPHPRRQKHVVVQTQSSEASGDTKAAKRGLIGGLVAAGVSLALRSGTSILAREVSNRVFARPEQPIHASNSPHHVSGETS